MTRPPGPPYELTVAEAIELEQLVGHTVGDSIAAFHRGNPSALDLTAWQLLATRRAANDQSLDLPDVVDGGSSFAAAIVDGFQAWELFRGQAGSDLEGDDDGGG